MPPARPIVFLGDFAATSGRAVPHGDERDLTAKPDRRPLAPRSPARGRRGRDPPGRGMPYIPEVVLGVGEPNVGKDREVAVETVSGRHLVGPDNGLLSRVVGSGRRRARRRGDQVAGCHPSTPRRVVPRARHPLRRDGAPRSGVGVGGHRRGPRPAHARGRHGRRARGRAGKERLVRETPPARSTGSASPSRRRSGSADRTASSASRGNRRLT